MKIQSLFLFAAVFLGVAQYTKFLITPYWMIGLIILLWFVLTYTSIHKKNKEKLTPKPVYLTN